MSTPKFQPETYLPAALFHGITELRVQDPDLILTEAARRRRRPHLTENGRLVIVATDHPGRRVTAAPGNPLGMGDRHSYLARAVRALTAPGVDGIMGTTDFMEELLLLSHQLRQAGKTSFLDGKVLIGCMNRGGHAEVEGEIDDRFTSFTARQLKRLHFEGGKLMYRIDLADSRTIESIDDCAQAVTELYREELYSFLEPLHVRRKPDGGYDVVKDLATLVKDAGAAAAMGESSARLFLKLAYCDGYEQVARATTLPILLLGGAAAVSPIPTLEDFRRGMDAGPNVRGAMIGRNITFAVDEDPRAVAAAVAAVIHQGCSVDQAKRILDEQRGAEYAALA